MHSDFEVFFRFAIINQNGRFGRIIMKKFLYSIPLTALLLITACGKEEIATVTKEEFDQLQKRYDI